MSIRTILITCLLAVGLVFLPAGGAQAHSILVSSNPASGARLATAPAVVQMTFSEGVEPVFSSFAVIDRTRKHYEAGTPVIDRTKGLVTVALQPNLAPADYIVQWRVVSVVDGHLTRGSFAFNVLAAPGAPTPTPGLTPATGGVATPQPTAESLPPPTNADTTGQSTAPSILDVAVRWLGTLLAACVAGGAAFNLLVVPGAVARLPGEREEQDEREDTRARLEMRFARGALAAALLLVLTLGAEFVLQAMRATESDLLSVFGQPGVFNAVLGSSFGNSIELRVLATLAGFALLLARVMTNRVGRWLWALLMLLGAGYFWEQTGSAHATALSEQPGAGILQTLAPLANLLHLLATAIWIGGIFYFVAILLPVTRALTNNSRAVLLRDSIARFSRLALFTVPVVAVSGTMVYLAEQPSVASTLDTGYGREVLIKVGLLALLMIPAAYNLRRVGPGLARLRHKIGPTFQALAQGFRRSIRAEALLVSTVLIFSALLTLSAPATDPSAYAGAPGTATPATALGEPTATASAPPVAEVTATTPPPSTLTLTQTVRGVAVALTIVHGGVDDLNVALRGPGGPITACGPTPTAGTDCALTVKLTFTQLEDNTSNTVAVPDAGNGTFAVPEGPYLPLDGTWQVVVAVRRYNQPEDIKASFRYVLAGDSMTGKISDYVNVDVSTNPSPARSGPMDLTFHLTDNNGQPVNDATITVQGLMPAHGHVTEVKKMSNSAGTYKTSLLMSMSGGWSVDLTIERPGHDTIAAEVSLDLAESSYDLTPYPSPNATPVKP